MNFRPNLRKVIVSIIVIVLGLVIINIYLSTLSQDINCVQCPYDVWKQCQHFSYLIPIIQVCGPCCTDFQDVLISWGIILLPGIVTYIVWSMAEPSRRKIKKNGMQKI